MLRSLGTAETTESQLAPGLPAGAEVGPGAGVEQARARRCSRPARARSAWRWRARPRPAVRPPGRGSAAAPRRSGSARSSAAGRPSRCRDRPASRRRSGCRRRTTRSVLELLQQRPRLADRPAPGLVVARAAAPCRPGRRSRGWCRRRCPASPRPSPARSTLPSPSGQPSPSSSRPATNFIARLLAGYRSSQEPLVTGPAPDQGHRGRVLRRLVGVARVRVGAEEDRPVRGHLVHDLAAVGVDHLRHVAQRPQVVLDRRRTARPRPRRTRCTRRRCRTARCSRASRRRTSASGPACPPAAGSSGRR